MAEASIFGLASRILSAIHDSESLEVAFQRAVGPTPKLEDLKHAVEAVKPYLLDAERREGSSDEIKNWIKAVREALYDADDLLEEVLANDLKAGRKGGRRWQYWRKVALSSTSSFSSSVIQDIKDQLVEAFNKIEQFGLEKQDEEVPNHLRPFNVEPKVGNISIREEDRKAILDFLLTDDKAKPVPLVIIAGSRGMGKTTIAQLVCKNEDVQKRYETVWWASMTDSFDEKEIYQRILQSMIGKSSRNLTLPLLKAKVRGCMLSVKAFLLVLDDIWAQDFDRFFRIKHLVKIVPKGSKIMLTSKRILDIPASDCIEVKTCTLDKLSEDDSKKLLGWYSENKSVGGKILEACEHVPLAMKSLSSLYYRNPGSLTIESLSKINVSADRQRAPLMFSYEHLNPDLKDCFAYCSLFPDNYIIHKRELVRLWVAQGYIRSEEEEAVGDWYFEQLLDRSFFQEPKEDDLGDMFCCKIHDLVHDVARQVAGKQYTTLMKNEEGQEQGNQPRNQHLRHMAVGYEIDASWKFPSELFREARLRSILFLRGGGGTLNPDVFDKILAEFKRLRALSLEKLNLNKVPSSIGELNMLKYLNLSHNNFKRLPDSITNLCNLLTLDITGCSELQVLPKSFSRLINLRHLYNTECHNLTHMPPGIGEMTALQEVGCFRVRKLVDDSECSRIGALGELKLTEMAIRFDHDWKQESAALDTLPETLRVLHIECYRGTDLTFSKSNLVELHLHNCASVKDLSSLGCLEHLKNLVLFWMDDLEQIVSLSVLSNLEKLVLRGLPKFIGWPRENEDCCVTRISFLKVEDCPELNYIPPSEGLKTLTLRSADAKLIEELLPSSSSSLEDVTVDDCDGLSCFKGEALTSLRRLKLFNCTSLKRVHLPPNLVIEQKIRNCPKLSNEDDKEPET